MARVGVLMDGSNVIASLYRANVGYPALGPLIDLLRGCDDLSYARFYGAPPLREPWSGRWKAFISANRHVTGLDFFQGYRHASSGEEKAIDVALATDLLYGKIADHFDRVAIVGGDGDLVYACKIANSVLDVRVYLLESGARGLARARVPYTIIDPLDLVRRGICRRGAGTPVPAAHRPHPGAPTRTPILHGSNAEASRKRG